MIKRESSDNLEHVLKFIATICMPRFAYPFGHTAIHAHPGWRTSSDMVYPFGYPATHALLGWRTSSDMYGYLPQIHSMQPAAPHELDQIPHKL